MRYKKTLGFLIMVTLLAILVFESRQSILHLTRKASRMIYTNNITYRTVNIETETYSILRSNVSIATENTTNHSSNWRNEELKKLGNLIQRRLDYIQNPRNCDDAKKIYCTYTRPVVGYGSQMHDWLTCLISAYATQRTLILNTKGWQYAWRGLETIFLPLSSECRSTGNQTIVDKDDLRDIDEVPVVKLPRSGKIHTRPAYLPYAIPDDIADDISRLHKVPSIWWIGQFLTFITRPNVEMQRFLSKAMNEMEFRHPIVGVHVRRTDKRNVARYHDLEEYMIHVERWFDNYEKNHKLDERRVYIASDDPGVLTEAIVKYPNYTFFNNTRASKLARYTKTRYSEMSLRDLVYDIQLLAECDFVVCTLTSNVGRIVYLLMSARHWDAPDRIVSLDTGYSFTGTLMTKKLLKSKLKRFNNTSVISDSSKDPLRPMAAIDNEESVVKMPTYLEVPRY